MKNIAFFELHQSYFIGFGLTFAILTNFHFLISVCLFAFLMPLFMLSSITAGPPSFDEAKPLSFSKKLHTNQVLEWRKPHPFSLFYLSRTILLKLDGYLQNVLNQNQKIEK